MTKFLNHITIEGERWDQLAQKYYGNSYAYPALVEANSSLAHLPTLMSGLMLRIPIIDRPALPVNLPPWRR
jgi:phage tail protein X